MRLLQLPAWFTGDWPSGSDLIARLRPPARPPRAAAAAAPGPAGDIAPAPPPRAGPQSVWTARRVETQAELWGTGHLSPGGAAEIMRCALPMGLTSAATLMLLGGGAGGPPLSLAIGLGAWISAFEADPVLLAMARALVKREPNALAKRVTLAAWNADEPELATNFFHHGVMHDHIRDAVPARILDLVTDALKPRGQLVLVETVAGPAHDAADPNYAAWCRLEGRKPGIPTAEAIERSLSRLGFDIRVQEDMTQRHIRLAMLGWKSMLRGLAADKPDRGHAAAVIMEAELWMRRIRLLSDSRLQVVRWHAIKTR